MQFLERKNIISSAPVPGINNDQSLDKEKQLMEGKYSIAYGTPEVA